MVGIKDKIWLIRLNRGSNEYIITTNPEFVEFFKKHRRHCGSLVWCRCFIQNKKYTIWTYLWLIKTFMVLKREEGIAKIYHAHSYGNSPEFKINTVLKKKDKDSYYFNVYEHSSLNENKVIKVFRTPLKEIENTVWHYRRVIGIDPVDYTNLKELLAPKGYCGEGIPSEFDKFMYPREETKEKPLPFYKRFWNWLLG